jgi:hypothetical protein
MALLSGVTHPQLEVETERSGHHVEESHSCISISLIRDEIVGAG